MQLKSVELAHKAANEFHLKHMGERYIEVFQCSLHDMSLMLATSQANQMASHHIKHINNNNNFVPALSPLPVPHVHNFLPPSPSLHPMISAVPAIFNATGYHQLSPTVNPVGFLPAHPLSLVRAMVGRLPYLVLSVSIDKSKIVFPI